MDSGKLETLAKVSGLSVKILDDPRLHMGGGAVTFNRYNKLFEYAGDNTIDLDDAVDQFYIMLMNATHVFTAANTLRTDVSANQIATANGYTQSTGGDTGKSMGTVTWVESGGVVTWDSPDIQWTASGGSIVADDAVTFADESVGVADAIMYSLDFGGTQTATDGGTFNLNNNASGIFSVP